MCVWCEWEESTRLGPSRTCSVCCVCVCVSGEYRHVTCSTCSGGAGAGAGDESATNCILSVCLSAVS